MSEEKNGVTYESLAQWQWRFRCHALWAAEQAGVSRELVLDTMKELGIREDNFPLGRGVRIDSEYDRRRLPVGSLLQRNEPDNHAAFGLFAYTRGGWVHLLGHNYDMNSHGLMLASGEEVEWATRPGTAEEQEELKAFKARAWRAGWKVKARQRWCDSYESYMAQMGFTDDVLHEVTHGGYTVGDRVNGDTASVLPAGSVLRWVSRADGQSFTYFIRRDDARNSAGTRAVFGHRVDGSGLRNSASNMEVVWIAHDDDEMALRIDNLLDIWEWLPVGTRLRSGGIALVLARDHQLIVPSMDAPAGAVPQHGVYAPEQFDGTLVVTGFPS